MRIIYLLTICLVGLSLQTANASPYQDNFVGVTVNGHPWGFWRVVDVGYNQDGDTVFISGGNEEIRYFTYWCVGFGPYVELRVSQGFALLLLLLTATLVVLGVRRKRRSNKSA